MRINRSFITLAIAGCCFVPVGMGWQSNLNKWGLMAAENTLQSSLDSRKQANALQQSERKELALQRALHGCVPVKDVKSGQMLNFLVNDVPVFRMNGVNGYLSEGDAVCSRKGDVAIIKNGVTAEKANVGFENLDAYSKIYERYLN